MMTEWESRGDPDSPATPLRVGKMYWGHDSLSSAQIKVASGSMELVPLGEGAGADNDQVYLIRIS